MDEIQNLIQQFLIHNITSIKQQDDFLEIIDKIFEFKNKKK